MTVRLIYLAWAGAGAAAITRFAESLGAHEPGADHALLVAWKGFADTESLQRARAALGGVAHEELTVASSGLDLSSYAEIARQLDDDVLCFVNTSSEILGDGWLGALARHLGRAEVGLAGASGSFESPLSGDRLLPRKLLRARRFAAFPNPHVRTNAFMLERATIAELWWPPVARKGAAWELESGNRSVTRQVQALGLQAVVVGRDGEGYPVDAWPRSRTFRSGDQGNLMVADNRTRQFADAPPSLRRRLARLAWGDGAYAEAGPT